MTLHRIVKARVLSYFDERIKGDMQADWYDAHNRHWHDAEKLHTDARWANADHLYGLAVECGLKRLMQALGMPIGSDGGPALAVDRKHADKLWVRYGAYRDGHYRGVAYVIPTSNPFGDWDVAQRYAAQSEFDVIRVTAHRTGADAIRRLVSKARLDGLIA